MPIPQPDKNEEKDKYISRCIKFVIDEGKPQKQAIAICYSVWDKSLGEGKMTITDRIDSYLNERTTPYRGTSSDIHFKYDDRDFAELSKTNKNLQQQIIKKMNKDKRLVDKMATEGNKNGLIKLEKDYNAFLSI